MTNTERASAIQGIRDAWQAAGVVSEEEAAFSREDAAQDDMWEGTRQRRALAELGGDPADIPDSADSLEGADQEPPGAAEVRTRLLEELVNLDATDVALELIAALDASLNDFGIAAKSYHSHLVYSLVQKRELKCATDIAMRVFAGNLIELAYALGEVYRADPTQDRLEKTRVLILAALTKVMLASGHSATNDPSIASRVWTALWIHTQDEKSHALAREIAGQLKPLFGGVAYHFLAKATGELSDYEAAFVALKKAYTKHSRREFRSIVLENVGDVIQTIGAKLCAALQYERMRERYGMTFQEDPSSLGEPDESSDDTGVTVITLDEAAEIVKRLTRIDRQWANALQKEVDRIKALFPEKK